MLMASASMRDYFREALSVALRRNQIRLTESAQVYVVNLLAEFSRAENAFAGTEPGESPVLADLLSRAHEAEPSEAVRIYKHMGDSSLYFTGFFSQAVERKPVSVDYYVSMGGNAYASVADLMRPTAASSSALFAELSDRFAALVELLVAMSLHSDRTPGVNDSRILALVERYRKTGAREVLEALKAHGVVLRPGLDDDDKDVN